MNEGRVKQDNLVETTDCLEAIGVFKGWKNALFIIVLLCLLLLQASFWLVDTGCVKADGEPKIVEAAPGVVTPPPASEPPAGVSPPPAKELVVPLEKSDTKQSAEKPGEIEKAAKEVVTTRQDDRETIPPQPQKPKSFLGMKVKHISWLIRFCNFVLILAAVLYCLTMLFTLKVSLLGRLGGINHISRAFFLSLTFLVLLLPWQRFFAGVVTGAIYTNKELLDSCAAASDYGIFRTALHYLRFTGYWVLVLLLLIFSQLRSARWAKATLRRLEVI